MPAPGVREETMVLLRYKVDGSAVMTDTSLVRARGVSRGLGASPSLIMSMVRESSVILVSGASRIPFGRLSRFRRFPWCCHLLMLME